MKEPLTIIKRMSAADRRQQILQHAFGLIREQGFKSVSVRDIARAAQVNEALIYRHFATKEDLLLAVVRETVNRQPVTTRYLPQDQEAFKNQLLEFVAFFMANAQKDPSILKIMLYAVMENYPLPDEFNYQKEGSFFNWLYRSIEKGKAEWNFNPNVDPLFSISSFMGGLIVFVLHTTVTHLFPNREYPNFASMYVGPFLKSLEA